MYKKLGLLFFIGICCAGTMAQQHIIIQYPFYRTHIAYTIAMPMGNIDTRYDVVVAAAPLPDRDTTDMHQYCITYATPDRPTIASASVTFNDSLYRNNRKVLFSDITHRALLNSIAQLTCDTITHLTHHNDTTIYGIVCHAITATQYSGEDVACRTLYLIDAETRQPILFRRENNPDMPSRHMVEARYISSDTTHYDFDKWVEQYNPATINQ